VGSTPTEGIMTGPYTTITPDDPEAWSLAQSYIPRKPWDSDVDACWRFLDSLVQNKKGVDMHMWHKYVAFAVGFVFEFQPPAPMPPLRLHELMEKAIVYPPGGAEGRRAFYKAIKHI
jgi:hypothetical protein